ncbi:MAG: VOC family protein [Rhodobacteraceae bacterium]|nr:VOC family protein [Paracoccaceae bacterium]
MLRLDHLAVSCARLDDGVAALQDRLGVPFSAGGQHAHMGTHNRLLSLGDLYLEVIAIDPAAPPPAWPRWFDLDNFSGPPRLTNWVAACDDLPAALAMAPPGAGAPVALARGDFRWQMAVPDDGKLPFDGAFPALIQWQGTAHPAPRLPDVGLRLHRLKLTHPQAAALQQALARAQMHDPRLIVETGPRVHLQASIATPAGLLLQV